MIAAVEADAAASPVARSDRIDVWSASLDVDAGRLAALAATLAPDEVRRAGGMRRGADRWRAARGLLREILARYVGAEPAGLAFSPGDGGKLALADPVGGPAFNLSHSGPVLLVAVGRDRRLGIDVERVRAPSTAQRVGERFFAPSESAALAALPAAVRAEAFTAVWARKEAVLKATGGGVGAGLTTFTVSVDPRAPARLLAPPPGERDAGWTLLDLEAPPGFRAALAADGGAFAVRRLAP